MTEDSSVRSNLGADAPTPASVPTKGWWAIVKRVWVNSGTHHIGLMSAGIAFYAFLSFVPLLGALVMSYGIFADSADVGRHMQLMIGLVPADAARLINDQLLALTESAADKKGLALLAALALSLFSASRASGAMIEALNVVYEQNDTRGLIKGTLVSIVLIGAAVIIGLFGIAAAALLAFTEELLGQAAPAAAPALRILAWLVAGTLCCFTLGAMYRYAPDRSDARWQWLSVGAVIGTILWLAATLLFGVYVANFGDYDTTYGSLGAVAVLLMWLFVSAYAVLIGAMINAEAERQTARDSTTGPELPMGSRGATVADTSAALNERR
jgi:membrane protein